MRLNVCSLISAPLMVIAGASVSFAQPPQGPPLQRPAYSPYLNLTRPGSLANNYYGLVRPQIEARDAINNLQSQYSSLNQTINNGPSANLPFPTTGHRTSFQNLSHYFSSNPTQSFGRQSFGRQYQFNQRLANEFGGARPQAPVAPVARR